MLPALVEPDPEWKHGRRGRSTDLSAKMTDAICRLVREGVKPARAAKGLGVDERLWYRWKQKAKQGMEPYKERIADIEVAEATFLAAAEICLGRAARNDWKASKEMLKSRAPTEYGDKLEIARDTDPPRELSHDELRAEAEAMGLPTSIFDADDVTEYYDEKHDLHWKAEDNGEAEAIEVE